MTQRETRTIQLAADLEVSVRETGDGPPLLLLHGGGGPFSIPTAYARLSRTHRVLAPVHPGYAGTPRLSRLNTVAALAATYADLLDHLGLRDVTVVGSSFGGWIATELALLNTTRPVDTAEAGAARPPRVSRVVLLDPVGPTPEQDHFPPLDAGGIFARPQPTADEQSLLVSYTGPAMHDPGLRARLADVAVPVLVVWGAEDPVLTPAYGRAYAAALPAGELVIVPDAGHLPTEEAPDATFAAIHTFLDTHPLSPQEQP